jgi:hypothetical protein
MFLKDYSTASEYAQTSEMLALIVMYGTYSLDNHVVAP